MYLFKEDLNYLRECKILQNLYTNERINNIALERNYEYIESTRFIV